MQAADRRDRDCLLLMRDYGFIFKMKTTKVSNPMQRKTKETRNEFKSL